MGVVEPNRSKRNNRVVIYCLIACSGLALIASLIAINLPTIKRALDKISTAHSTEKHRKTRKTSPVDKKAKANELARRSYYLSNNGQDKKVEKVLNEALALDPTNIHAYWRKASHLTARSRFEDALQELDVVFRLNPDEAPGLRIRAEIYRNLGQFDLALRDLNKAISLQPNFSWVYHYRAKLFTNMNRLSEAKNDIDEFLRRRPNSHYGLARRALILRRLGNYQAALVDINKAIKINQTDKSYLKERQRIQCMQGGEGSKLETLTKHIKTTPGDINPLLNRAKFFGENREFVLGLADVDTALNLKPNSLPALKARMRLLRWSHRYDEALQVSNKIIALDPKNARNFLNRAKALRRKRRYLDALSAIEKSLKLKASTKARRLQKQLQHEFKLYPTG